jgi:hypothetical protein
VPALCSLISNVSSITVLLVATTVARTFPWANVDLTNEGETHLFAMIRFCGAVYCWLLFL